MLTTERLQIERFDPDEDLAAAARIYSDPLVMRFVAGGPHLSTAQTETLLSEYASQQERCGFSYWAVRLRADRRLIGDCGLYPLEGRGPEIELGFTLARDCWGMGLATEAAAACVGYAFDALRFDELHALVMPAHVASRRVLEKLGFGQPRPRQAHGAAHLELLLRARR
jgi:ribosomal-protein-alanine N-acetyltransferase